MYCKWSQAPEIRSLGTKITVDANRFFSPAVLHNALHGPRKSSDLATAFILHLSTLWLISFSWVILSFKQRWTKFRLFEPNSASPKAIGWKPTYFFGSLAMATNLCVAVWGGPIKDKDHLQSWNLHLELKFSRLKGFRSDVWEWSPSSSS